MYKTPDSGSAKTAGKAADMWRIGKALAVLAVLVAAPVLAQEIDPAPNPEKLPAKECQPDIGCVTNLPLPDYYSGTPPPIPGLTVGFAAATLAA